MRSATFVARDAVRRALGVLPLAALLALACTPGVARGAELRPVELPRDHGAHPRFGVEWWYTTGRATAPGGRRFFWFATIWSSPRGAVGRVNVVDVSRDEVVLAQEWARQAPFARRTRELIVGGLAIRWLRDGRLGRLTVDARPRGGDRLRMTLRPRRPYTLHGARGIVPQGAGGASAYYSATRLDARGALRSGGRRRSLRGLAWFDHQWGDFAAAPNALRWDWFACQLADGRDLMLTHFLGAGDQPLPAPRHGTLVGARGRVTRLDAFTATPTGRTIQPPGARASYPLGWRLQVPSAGLDLTLRALARDQFVANRFVPSFWEGAAEIVRGPRGACTVESSREVPPVQ